MRRILIGIGAAAVISVSACGGDDGADSPAGGGTGGTASGGTGGSSSGGTIAGATGGAANTNPENMTPQELAVAYCEDEYAQATAGGCEGRLDPIEMCVDSESDGGPFQSEECNAVWRARIICRLTRGSLRCDDRITWLGCDAETRALDPCWE